VIIGGVISFFNTSRLETRKQAAESRRLALAFRGEIRALLRIVNRRRYLEGFQSIVEKMETAQIKVPINIKVRREYFPVFKNNVTNIGSLECPLPELIAQFYVQANSVLEDIESYHDGTLEHDDIQSLTGRVKETHALLQETLVIGEEIIKEVNLLYPSYPRPKTRS
jgi:hypothetical protein